MEWCRLEQINIRKSVSWKRKKKHFKFSRIVGLNESQSTDKIRYRMSVVYGIVKRNPIFLANCGHPVCKYTVFAILLTDLFCCFFVFYLSWSAFDVYSGNHSLRFVDGRWTFWAPVVSSIGHPVSRAGPEKVFEPVGLVTSVSVFQKEQFWKQNLNEIHLS